MQRPNLKVLRCMYCGRPIHRGIICRSSECQLKDIADNQTRDINLAETSRSRRRRQNLFKDKRKAGY